MAIFRSLPEPFSHQESRPKINHSKSGWWKPILHANSTIFEVLSSPGHCWYVGSDGSGPCILAENTFWSHGHAGWEQSEWCPACDWWDSFHESNWNCRNVSKKLQMVNRSWALSPIARPVNTSKTPPHNRSKCRFRSLTQDSSLPWWKEKCSESIQNEICNSATDESASAGMGPPKQQHLCRYLAENLSMQVIEWP